MATRVCAVEMSRDFVTFLTNSMDVWKFSTPTEPELSIRKTMSSLAPMQDGMGGSSIVVVVGVGVVVVAVVVVAVVVVAVVVVVVVGTGVVVVVVVAAVVGIAVVEVVAGIFGKVVISSAIVCPALFNVVEGSLLNKVAGSELERVPVRSIE